MIMDNEIFTVTIIMNLLTMIGLLLGFILLKIQGE